jgi:hypothetical protein
MEYFNGVAWNIIPASTTGLFVDKTSSTGSAVIPAGTSAQRDAAPGVGYTRYNSTIGSLEFWDGSSWEPSGSPLGLGLAFNNVNIASKTPEASVPPTIGGGPTNAFLGSTYYDDNLGQLFLYYSNGGSPVWVAV